MWRDGVTVQERHTMLCRTMRMRDATVLVLGLVFPSLGCASVLSSPEESSAVPWSETSVDTVGDEVRTAGTSPGAPTESADPPSEEPEPIPDGPASEPLACGLHNPMPGGYAAGYAADTGLDLAGMKSPVFAIASGAVDYAEAGHSLWTGRGDTDLAVRIELDEPIELEDGRRVTHVWYAHLYELAFEQKGGAKKRRRVAAGQYLGLSGRANGMWHLHLGLLLDGETTQAWGTFLLEDEVRGVLCGMRKKSRLPASTKAPAR
jgi:hypothetical protein